MQQQNIKLDRTKPWTRPRVGHNWAKGSTNVKESSTA